jgi:hypothetical protein
VQEPTIRGIVLRESLTGGQLPMPMQATVTRRYPYLLGGELPVEVIELVVSRDRALTVAMQLAEALLPQRFYAHLLDDTRMYVAFPGCIALICRGDEASVRRAQDIGQRYEIPTRQMRFGEMFDNDHPDAPASGDGKADPAWTL